VPVAEHSGDAIDRDLKRHVELLDVRDVVGRGGRCIQG
jgi:hypothetical protein